MVTAGQTQNASSTSNLSSRGLIYIYNMLSFHIHRILWLCSADK